MVLGIFRMAHSPFVTVATKWHVIWSRRPRWIGRREICGVQWRRRTKDGMERRHWESGQHEWNIARKGKGKGETADDRRKRGSHRRKRWQTGDERVGHGRRRLQTTDERGVHSRRWRHTANEVTEQDKRRRGKNAEQTTQVGDARRKGGRRTGGRKRESAA